MRAKLDNKYSSSFCTLIYKAPKWKILQSAYPRVMVAAFPPLFITLKITSNRGMVETIKVLRHWIGGTEE